MDEGTAPGGEADTSRAITRLRGRAPDAPPPGPIAEQGELSALEDFQDFQALIEEWGKAYASRSVFLLTTDYAICAHLYYEEATYLARNHGTYRPPLPPRALEDWDTFMDYFGALCDWTADWVLNLEADRARRDDAPEVEGPQGIWAAEPIRGREGAPPESVSFINRNKAGQRSRNQARDKWVDAQRQKNPPVKWGDIYDKLLAVAPKRKWQVPNSWQALSQANQRYQKALRKAEAAKKG